MLNKTILMGRFVRDPDLRYTQSNTAVASFTLAIDRDRKGPNGERQTDFIDCVAWGKQAEFVSQWFKKGMLAIVVGRIQSRNWEDKNGNKRVTIEINTEEVTFGETKKSREGNAADTTRGRYDGYNSGYSAPQQQPEYPTGDLTDFGDPGWNTLADDSDVPF